MSCLHKIPSPWRSTCASDNEHLKKLRRWTKEWNVFLASERQTRKATEEIRGQVDIGSELVQTIRERDGENVPVPAAFSWVENLLQFVVQQLTVAQLEQAVMA